MKKVYTQPTTKITSLSSYGNVCEFEVTSDNFIEELYGSPVPDEEEEPKS